MPRSSRPPAPWAARTSCPRTSATARTTAAFGSSTRSAELGTPPRARPSDGDDYLARDMALFLMADRFPDVVERVRPADDGGDLALFDERGQCREDLFLRRARDGIRHGYPLRHQRAPGERREHVPGGLEPSSGGAADEDQRSPGYQHPPARGYRAASRDVQQHVVVLS